MRLKGKISPGALRGSLLIERFHYRIRSILGFEPFKGTLDIRLEKPVEVKDFSTKTIEHILVDGSKLVEAYLAPAVLHVKDNDHKCWVIRPAKYTQNKEFIEIIDKDHLKDKLSLKEGEEVEVTLCEKQKDKKDPPGMGLLRRLYGKETRLKV